MQSQNNAKDIVNKLFDAWNNKDTNSMSKLVSDDVIPQGICTVVLYCSF